MNVYATFTAILRYIETVRRVGHTTSSIQACLENDAVLVVSSYQYAKDLEGKHGIKTISLGEFKHNGMCGRREPLIFDTEAIFHLLHSALYDDESMLKQFGVLLKDMEAIKKKLEVK